MDEDRRSGDGRRGDTLTGCDGGASADVEPVAESLPQSLRQRLDRCADDWLSECRAQRAASYVRKSHRRSLPWLVAAVAFAFAIVGWWPRLADLQAGAAAQGGLAQWRAERARARMLSSPGVEHHAWGAIPGVGSGDVVWDPRTQRGFLRLEGYVANDPASARYQLWIFDAARDDRYPVDGGVFDVPAGRDEVIIPVHPTLPVSRAVAFAVTVEQPGGAVVSDRAKLVALAHVGM